MRLLAAWLLFALFFLPGLAQNAPAELTAAPASTGTTSTSPGAGSLGVEAPEPTNLLGIERLSKDRFLVSLYVPDSIQAGTYLLRFTFKNTQNQETAFETKVIVPYRPRIRLLAPEEASGTLGKRLDIALVLRNEGNAPDRFYLELSGNDPARIEPAELELGSGEEKKLRLTLQPTEAGERYLLVRVYSKRTGGFLRSKGVAYRVLPYAGADPERPSLTYRLPLSLTIAPEGLDAKASVELGGPLSDFARGRARSQLSAQTPNLALGLSFEGGSIGLGYRWGQGGSAQLELEPYRFSFRYDTKGTATWTAGFTHGAFSTLFLHRRGERSESRVDLSYRFGIAPGLSWSPRLSLDLRPDGGASFGAGLTYTGKRFLAQASALWRPKDQTWRFATHLASTALEPYAGALSLRTDPEGSALRLELLETRPDLEIRHAVEYGEGFRAELEGRWLSPPHTTYAKTVFEADAEENRATLWLASVRREAPWTTRLSLSFSGGARVRVSQSRDFGRFSLGGIGQLSFKDAIGLGLGARLGYREEDVGLGISYVYDFQGMSLSGALAFAYAPEFGPRLSAELFYDPEEGFQWSLGTELDLEGGFEVPPPVVELFGGRNLGEVEGRVLYREEGLKDIKLRAVRQGTPVAETTTDEAGRFRFILPPGTYQLEFLNLPATLTPETRPVRFEIRRKAKAALRVELRESLAVVGQVYLEAEGRKRIAPFVWVVLEGEGLKRTIQSDEQGRFVFRDLVPGRYRVFVDQKRLPRALEPLGRPQSVELKPGGAVPNLALGIARKKPKLVSSLDPADLTLTLSMEPTSAPRGAEIEVVAESPGAHRVEAFLANGPRVTLEPVAPGRFHGFLKLEADTKARAVFLYVEARKGEHTRTLRRLIRITRGALARITLSDPAPFPGDALEAKARFLYRPRAPYLVLARRRIALEPADARTFVAPLTAPEKPGVYPLELWDGDTRVAKVTLHVAR